MILPPVEYPTLFHVRNVPLLSFEFVRDDSLTEVVSEEPYRIRVCLDSDDAAPTLTLNRALNVVDVRSYCGGRYGDDYYQLLGSAISLFSLHSETETQIR